VDSKNYKKKLNKKLLVSIVVLVFVSIASIAGIVTVLALTQRNIDSSIFIRFTAIDIDGEVEAAYRVGNADTWTSMSGETPHVFNASDAESNAQMNPGDIKLTSTNNFVEFRYTFRNFGDADYTGILTLDEVVTENNMEIQYKYNDSVYSTSSYGLVVEGVDTADSSELKTRGEDKYTEMIYYVKVSVKELSKSANYSSDFFWLLERYDGEVSGEVIPLVTSEYVSNGDGTYSVRYKGADIDVANVSTDSSYKIENVWTIPNNFGSASVTKVIKGESLPTNTKVILGGNISDIVADTFQEDTNLIDIVFGKKVTKIPNSAFKNCTSLTSIDIPEGVTTIGDYAFYGCTGAKIINIPSSVTLIGEDYEECNSFANCTGVEVLNYNANFNDFAPGCWFSGLGTSATKTVVNINSMNLKGYLFRGCVGINEVCFGENVTDIPDCEFFSGCTGLSNVKIGKNVTYIGERAFRGCTSLTSVVIPANVSGIGMGAFSGCTSLTSVVIPANVSGIGMEAFLGCTKLTSVKFENIENWTTTVYCYTSSDSGWETISVYPSATDFAANATMLKSTYTYPWSRQ